MSSKLRGRAAIALVLGSLLGCEEQPEGPPASGAGGSGGAPAGAGGGTGGTSSGGGGGVTATGGTLVTGGATGSGGHTGGGPSVPPGGGASGGTSGATGGASSGGSGGAAAPRDAGAAGCDGASLCSSFEEQNVGAVPSGFVIVDPEMGGTPDTAAIDAIGARGSSRSLKVVSHGRIWVRTPASAGIAALGPSLHVHFFVRFAAPLPSSHVSFVALNVAAPRDAYDENNELRFGGQEGVFHWNNALNDRNVPSVSPAGNAASTKPLANTWYCVSLTVDKSTGRFSAEVDGTTVAALTQDGTATPDVDAEWLGDARLATWTGSLVDVSFGFRSYGGGEATVWFDDVAISNAPLPCH